MNSSPLDAYRQKEPPAEHQEAVRKLLASIKKGASFEATNSDFEDSFTQTTDDSNSEAEAQEEASKQSKQPLNHRQPQKPRNVPNEYSISTQKRSNKSAVNNNNTSNTENNNTQIRNNNSSSKTSSKQQAANWQSGEDELSSQEASTRKTLHSRKSHLSLRHLQPSITESDCYSNENASSSSSYKTESASSGNQERLAAMQRRAQAIASRTIGVQCDLRPTNYGPSPTTNNYELRTSAKDSHKNGPTRSKAEHISSQEQRLARDADATASSISSIKFGYYKRTSTDNESNSQIGRLSKSSLELTDSKDSVEQNNGYVEQIISNDTKGKLRGKQQLSKNADFAYSTASLNRRPAMKQRPAGQLSSIKNQQSMFNLSQSRGQFAERRALFEQKQGDKIESRAHQTLKHKQKQVGLKREQELESCSECEDVCAGADSKSRQTQNFHRPNKARRSVVLTDFSKLPANKSASTFVLQTSADDKTSVKSASSHAIKPALKEVSSKSLLGVSDDNVQIDRYARNAPSYATSLRERQPLDNIQQDLQQQTLSRSWKNPESSKASSKPTKLSTKAKKSLSSSSSAVATGNSNDNFEEELSSGNRVKDEKYFRNTATVDALQKQQRLDRMHRETFEDRQEFETEASHYSPSNYLRNCYLDAELSSNVRRCQETDSRRLNESGLPSIQPVTYCASMSLPRQSTINARNNKQKQQNQPQQQQTRLTTNNMLSNNSLSRLKVYGSTRSGVSRCTIVPVEQEEVRAPSSDNYFLTAADIRRDCSDEDYSEDGVDENSCELTTNQFVADYLRRLPSIEGRASCGQRALVRPSMPASQSTRQFGRRAATTLSSVDDKYSDLSSFTNYNHIQSQNYNSAAAFRRMRSCDRIYEDARTHPPVVACIPQVPTRAQSGDELLQRVAHQQAGKSKKSTLRRGYNKFKLKSNNLLGVGGSASDCSAPNSLLSAGKCKSELAANNSDSSDSSMFRTLLKPRKKLAPAAADKNRASTKARQFAKQATPQQHDRRRTSKIPKSSSDISSADSSCNNNAAEIKDRIGKLGAVELDSSRFRRRLTMPRNTKLSWLERLKQKVAPSAGAKH